jgi:hypothetical protein
VSPLDPTVEKIGEMGAKVILVNVPVAHLFGHACKGVQGCLVARAMASAWAR